MSDPVKFYMDEHVHPAITRGLRLRGIDVLTAQEAQTLGASDKEHLSLAASLDRVLFTHDNDFLKLHSTGLAHAGIAFAHQRTSIGRIVRALTLIHEILSVEEMANRVEFLQQVGLEKSAHIDIIAERLRLLYVGITRARRFLQLSRSRATRSYNKERDAEPATVMGVLYRCLQEVGE